LSAVFGLQEVEPPYVGPLLVLHSKERQAPYIRQRKKPKNASLSLTYEVFCARLGNKNIFKLVFLYQIINIINMHAD